MRVPSGFSGIEPFPSLSTRPFFTKGQDPLEPASSLSRRFFKQIQRRNPNCQNAKLGQSLVPLGVPVCPGRVLLEVATEHLKNLLPRILASEDAAEGVASFLERREATFKGQ